MFVCGGEKRKTVKPKGLDCVIVESYTVACYKPFSSKAARQACVSLG